MSTQEIDELKRENSQLLIEKAGQQHTRETLMAAQTTIRELAAENKRLRQFEAADGLARLYEAENARLRLCDETVGLVKLRETRNKLLAELLVTKAARDEFTGLYNASRLLLAHDARQPGGVCLECIDRALETEE